MTIFTIFIILTIFTIFYNFLQFFTILTIFDNFYYFLQFFTTGPLHLHTPAALGSVWNYDLRKQQKPFITWTYQPSNLPTFRPSNLPTFPKRQCLETGELTKFFEYFKGFCCFTLSGHFWIRKVSRNRRFDQILWILQGILSFYCF